jgi:hypothetical protein
MYIYIYVYIYIHTVYYIIYGILEKQKLRIYLEIPFWACPLEPTEDGPSLSTASQLWWERAQFRLHHLHDPSVPRLGSRLLMHLFSDE